VTLHTKIRGRYKTIDIEGNPVSQVYDTTPGRMILGELLPKNGRVKFDIVNQEMTKKNISKMIDHVYRHSGQKDTVIFCDRIMQLGFKHACMAGISFGKDDMVIPETKAKLVEDTQSLTKEYEQQYNDGLITQGEKYNKVVDAWAKCGDKVADEMMDRIKAVHYDEESKRQLPMNSIYMMSHSGARGSPTQMKQLAGMRGLMAKPSGEIIESPIISNFKEGLTVLEYFNSTHGARKGIADTALKTANSGYLTRRLVDVAQDCIVTQEDCGTENGLTMQAVVDAGQVVASLGMRILGRTAAEDILHPETGEVLIEKNHLMDEQDVDKVEEAGVKTVLIRSALTCETQNGICAACYGRDLARGTPVNMGEAVGVIAAQSIGEPGTQLTMRTFHIGGTAQVVDSSFLEASYEGTIRIRNSNIAKDSDGNNIVMGRNVSIVVEDEKGVERASHRVNYGARILVAEGDKIKQSQRMAEWDPYTRPMMTEVDGTIEFEDVVDGLSVQENADESTGITKRVVVDWRANPRGADLKPAIVIKDKNGEVAKLKRGGEARILLSVDAILSVEPGSKVKAGDVLARIPTESAKTKDITGGLPRVAELFEARRPKDHAVIATIDGTIRYGRDYKNKRRISIEPNDSTLEPAEYLIPKSKPFHLQDGDPIEKGDYILDGNPAPHDILAIRGVEALASYLVNEIQDVYRLQGVIINDKHIEVIVRQMLQKVEITTPGDTGLLEGEQIDRIEMDILNERMEEEGKQSAQGDPVLLGITKASLQTRSFISAASFQETTRVLTEASVAGKSDTLEGLKENVIVGRLIPAGTGGVMSRMRRLANSRDDMIIDERRKTAEAEALIEDMSADVGEPAE
ncbi:MAG: DNA-directed RNA polymerase subunit beta', partial [Pseudomonadota bacterium]